MKNSFPWITFALALLISGYFLYKSSKIPDTRQVQVSDKVNEVKKQLSLAHRIAEINFSHQLSENYSAIAAAQKYLTDLSIQYHSDPATVSGRCVYIRKTLQEKGHDVTLFEVFDAAKVIRSVSKKNLTDDDLAKTLAMYAVQRDKSDHVDLMADLRKFLISIGE